MSEQRLKTDQRIVNLQTLTNAYCVQPWGPAGMEAPAVVRKSVYAYKAFENELQNQNESAYRSGFEDGRKMGYRESLENAKALLNNLRGAAAGLIREKTQIMQQSTEMITRLAIMIAGKLIHHELRTDESRVRDIVIEIIKAIDIKGAVTLRLNPDDWKILKQVESEIHSTGHEIERLDIFEDPQIQRGGCIVSGGSGTFDAQLETQLEEISRRLLESK